MPHTLHRQPSQGLPAGFPIAVSYSYMANGRLEVEGKVEGHESGVKSVFHRENSMDDGEPQLWLQCILAEEMR